MMTTTMIFIVVEETNQHRYTNTNSKSTSIPFQYQPSKPTQQGKIYTILQFHQLFEGKNSTPALLVVIFNERTAAHSLSLLAFFVTTLLSIESAVYFFKHRTVIHNSKSCHVIYMEQQANSIFHLGETKLARPPVVYSLSI